MVILYEALLGPGVVKEPRSLYWTGRLDTVILISSLNNLLASLMTLFR